jgi:ATP-binding cassette subfamily G (WHITE) protein 2 (SNQ2)
MVLLFNFFQASWGQCSNSPPKRLHVQMLILLLGICAFAPSFTVISNVLPFFFVMFSLFNGVVRPYASLPVFWRYWM